MKGLLRCPEMLGNPDAPPVLTNSNVGHLMAHQVRAFLFFLRTAVEPPFDVSATCFISGEQSRVPSD